MSSPVSANSGGQANLPCTVQFQIIDAMGKAPPQTEIVLDTSVTLGKVVLQSGHSCGVQSDFDPFERLILVVNGRRVDPHSSVAKIAEMVLPSGQNEKSSCEIVLHVITKPDPNRPRSRSSSLDSAGTGPSRSRRTSLDVPSSVGEDHKSQGPSNVAQLPTTCPTHAKSRQTPAATSSRHACSPAAPATSNAETDFSQSHPIHNMATYASPEWNARNFAPNVTSWQSPLQQSFTSPTTFDLSAAESMSYESWYNYQAQAWHNYMQAYAAWYAQYTAAISGVSSPYNAGNLQATDFTSNGHHWQSSNIEGNSEGITAVDEQETVDSAAHAHDGESIPGHQPPVDVNGREEIPHAQVAAGNDPAQPANNNNNQRRTMWMFLLKLGLLVYLVGNDYKMLKGYAVLGLVFLVWMLQGERLHWLLKIAYPVSRFDREGTQRDPEPYGVIRGTLYLGIAFVASLVPAPYEYA